ncbi:MFS transporter [Gammaproteobacteria bacterium LSUCC0112]|nr:MFS transporter [Gammaproteobacteria bacterium LSUCC0112]
MTNALHSLINRSINIREGEGPALFLSGLYYFVLLCAYYIIRPIRDDMGAAGGVDNLAWLFTGTLTGMMILHPIYSAIVSRMPRRQFIAVVYRFFMAQLVLFYLLFQSLEGVSEIWAGRVFFVWTSVFNLFVISVFWSLVNDIFRPSQSKRLFGVIAVGGTAGALTGSAITSFLAAGLGAITLLLVSAALLEVAAWVSRYLSDNEQSLAMAAIADEAEKKDADIRNLEVPEESVVTQQVSTKQTELIGGGTFDGVMHVLRSPYLLGIAALMLFFTIVSTYLYFMQIAIVNEALGDDREARTQLFANRDLIVNAITLIVQMFLTGRILRWLGIGVSLALLPVISFVGFGLLAVAPVLAVVIGFDVLRRVGNFAIQRPARESLYTVVSRTDKYKAKNFNDTFVYRVGDQLGAWSYTAMMYFGLGLTGLALTMLPVSLIWVFIAMWLGTQYKEKNKTAV